MSLSSLSRGPRTVLVGIGLVIVYFSYSRLTSPLLKVEQHRVAPAAAPRLPANEKSLAFSEQAQKWFREDPWVLTANGRFRDNGRLLAFETHELFNDNRSIRIKPVALLWEQDQDGDGVPITATADSAQLDASTKFSFAEGQFGKITSGLLAGVVRITGPDQLRIEGRTFYISDDAMKVWTGQPVRFRWQDHSGIADGGAEIELQSSADSSSAGLMAITDVQRIRLLGRVRCNLIFNDDKAEREPVQLNINAANGFEFFVPTREATFYGFLDRELKKDNQILIERPMADGNLDRLFCSKLVLQFQPKVQTPEKTARRSSQLRLVRITAEGPRVVCDSRHQNLTATMGMLRYHLMERQIEMLGRMAASTGQGSPVEIYQNGSRVNARHVVIAHDEHNNVLTIECRGPGLIGPSDRDAEARDENAVDASWTESLLYTDHNEQKVTLRGSASVIQPRTGMSLSGQVIEMLLEKVIGSETPKAAAPALRCAPLNVSSLRPQRLTALENVRMVSRELSGTARQKLIVVFPKDSAAAGNTPPDAAQPDQQTSSPEPVRTVSSSREESRRLSGTTEFTSDTVETAVRLAAEGPPQFEDVWLKGDVLVTHKSTRKDQSFTAQGNVLLAKGGFQGDREINLFGDPATVVNDSNRIEGQRIDLTDLRRGGQAAKTEARVSGSGRIRFVIKTGFDGKELAKPSPLDIYWGGHMTFSGRTAHFVGNIRAVMNNETDHDVEVTCAGMKVHFSDPVQLRKSPDGDEFELDDSVAARAGSGEIELIECESRVVVDIDIMKNGIVEAHHHAEFNDLKFNTQTGDFHAVGPGLIESVQPDTGRKLATSNRAVASANAPARTSENAFVFIHARFIGELQGNQNERYVHLRQHVRGVFGPVRELTERINVDGLSVDQLPENTGSLGCENLSISVIPGATPDQNSFSLVAESNAAGGSSGTRSPCRLESRQFAGDADKITYDHSKQQFILRGDEGREAKVSYRQNGGEPQVLRGGRFEYYTDRNQLNANQITGVQASGGP